jgi:hypothetical protein
VGKKSSAKSAGEKGRRRLVKAQMGLQIAQDKRRLAITKGEDEIEKVRQRAARRVEKATKRVEKYAALVSETESHLKASGVTDSPLAASDYLSSVEDLRQSDHRDEPIVLPTDSGSPAQPDPLSIEQRSTPEE